MTAATQSAHLPHLTDSPGEPMASRTIPIMTPTIQMSAPSPGDPMEITTPTNSSPAPAQRSDDKSPEREINGASNENSTTAANGFGNGKGDSTSPPESAEPTPTKPEPNSTHLAAPSASGTSAGSQIPAAAAPAVHQPKIVQTAFIHKLYNQYFKHTNISSFVRQLNMYGFHKVSDVFANGSDSTTLWEFKHGNGNFKRGDLVGLREIKRRASRHSLVHRDYNAQKAPQSSQPGTPAEAMPIPDGSDPRMSSLDHAFYNIESRLQRNEEAMHYMHIKHQAAMDTIGRLLHFNQEMSRILMNMMPPTDSHLHRDVIALQGEIQRQAEMARGLDESHEHPFSSSRPYFANVDNAPVSPRQMPQDDPRRSNLSVPQQRPPNFHRPPVPSNLSISTRRPYGSIGGTTQSSPSSVRPQHPPPPPPPSQHPLATVEPSPNMARRHTSADIRAHGWQPTNAPYPPTGGPPLPPTQYPSSPSRAGPPEDQRIRDSFSAYSLQSASQPHSRPETPPPTLPPFANGSNHGNGNGPDLGNWSWASANRSNNSLNIKDSSAPPTRRGSMAHILNPTDTAEREDEDGSPREDERKRKRMV
ncbi:heat shock transcription factor [Sporothrix schenckii 1099-18]|uniref:Heat shock transcription factor n=1 Tax=Sporothrix schenckii 1099-18 TaxID=1397361 RepID=A0A0F2MBA9_SPOSC|nr:heat shock transcription factor [Sporothrix schenckii 1099-18]KJR85436.1 heat shock transcription factor [Sporothrix schenckii 1099-18]